MSAALNTPASSRTELVKVKWHRLVVSARGVSAYLLLILLAALILLLWSIDPGHAGLVVLGLAVSRV